MSFSKIEQRAQFRMPPTPLMYNLPTIDILHQPGIFFKTDKPTLTHGIMHSVGVRDI
jgi:hypothetical protein